MRAAVSLVFLAVATTTAGAQPADAPAPDYARASDLYQQAEAEMAAGDFAGAARDYAIAYDITKDPILFFKIGSADDKAGRCDLALTYYRRYLKEANPDETYRGLTEERIVACEGATGTTAGDVGAGAGGTAATGDPGDTGTAGGAGASTTGASTGDATAATDPAAARATERPSLSAEHPSRTRGIAWITLGVGIALGTIGTVAALSANAAEKDLTDLYEIRVGGAPLPYSPATQQRHDDLIAQGKRYEKVSWIAFGAAGAAVVGAALLFVASRHDDPAAEAPPVGVSVSGSGATVTGAWSF